MARIVMFMRNESFCGEAERNNEFRKIVKEFVPFILDGEITFNEYTVNTNSGFYRAFEENPDCVLVFTTENEHKAQYEALVRGKMIFEWRYFSNKKLIPVKFEKKNLGCGIISSRISHYGIS